MKNAILYLAIIFVACQQAPPKQEEPKVLVIFDSTISLGDTALLPAFADSASVDSVIKDFKNEIDTRNVRPEQIVAFAQTLIGVPYRYGSTNPSQGFDCSGFITYVFNKFKIAVPRSSVDFTNVGTEVSTAQARPGDLILFTGTDSTIRIVGHMGIVTDNQNGELSFIHSTSGKTYGVTVTPLSTYYKTRFVKVIRVFP